MNTSRLDRFDHLIRIAIIIPLLLITIPAQARILNVPFEYFTIQSAIDAAQANDTVLVANGRFAENLNFNNRSLTLAGRYLLTNDPRDIAVTVIDGGYNGRSAIRLANGEGGLICGFTIVNDSTDYGGGIYCRMGMLTIRNMVIENNAASRNGGGIYITGGAQVIVRDVVLRNNRCGNVGGAMSAYTGAQVLVERVEMTGNYAAHVGGAYHGYGSRVQIVNCTLADNDALHNGGGIYLTQEAVLDLQNSILWNNEPHEVWIMAGFEQTLFRPSFNLIQGNLEKVWTMAGVNMQWGIENFSADPLFVDPANGNYSLEEASPALDRGDYESPPDHDGTRSDLGAYPVDQGNDGQRVYIHPGEFNAIQDAIDASHDGDVVLVLPGEYQGNIDFSSKAITVASRTISTGIASYADSTIIDAGGQGSVVMFANEEGEASILDGFTLTGGVGTYYEPQHYFGNVGGGVYCLDASPVVRNCLITENQLANRGQITHGGGVFVGGHSEPLLKNLRIVNNRAEYGAGMAFRGESFVTMENVTISDNRATAGDDSWGGGIWCFENASFEMDGGMISGNHAAGGGAISMTVNTGTSTVRKVAIVDNEGYWGAAYYGTAFPMVFENVTFSGNGYGQQGASLFEMRSRRATLNIGNSILFDNPSRLFRFWNNEDRTDTLVIDYCLIQGGEDSIRANQYVVLDYGDHNFDADPLFVDPDNSDYSLTENSPCIDAGDPESERDPDGTHADVGAIYFHQIIERDPVVITVPGDFPTIQQAIDAAQNDDTVIVDQGNYRENINFNGRMITVASRFLNSNDPEDIRNTIIDGGGNAETVRFGRAENNTSRLIGFTITGGNGLEGGGIFCLRASPTIAYCVIAGNEAQEGGGGIYIYGSNPHLNNVTIVSNHSQRGGGGIHLRNAANAALNNSILYHNEPNAVEVSADRDQCFIYLRYSIVEGDSDGFVLNGNGFFNMVEGNIDANPLFVDPENGDYRLSENSPCIDAGEEGLDPDIDGSPGDIGALAFVHLPEIVLFHTSLRRGWGLVGASIVFPDLSMPVIWQRQVETDRLFLVKDQDGRFFAPRSNFNNIPEWVFWQGYAYKMDEADTLRTEGILIDPATPIPLREGWSIISYFPRDTVLSVSAFSEIADDIFLVKDENGRFFHPRYGYHDLVYINPGKGYKIRMLRARELVWGRDPEMAAQKLQIDPFAGVAPRFEPANTGNNMSVLVSYSFDREIDLAKNDAHYIELAAFNTNGLAVGYGRALLTESPVLIGLAVWGDDPTTGHFDGCRNGEPFTIRGWIYGEETDVDVTWQGGEPLYKTDRFLYGEANSDGIIPSTFALGTPFPNPFNSTVRISYQTPVADEISLKIYDLAGRETAIIAMGRMQAGYHQAVWKAENEPSGIYFCRMEAGSFSQSVKLLLVR